MRRVTPKTVRHRFPALAALAAFIAFVLLVAAAGCSSVPSDARELAGRYELRSVDGRPLPDDRLGGAIAGELVLTANGRATRRVTYARSGLPTPYVQLMEGTYDVADAELTLFLVTDVATPASRREFRGEVTGASIVVRYPGRSDATVEERYVRVP